MLDWTKNLARQAGKLLQNHFQKLNAADIQQKTAPGDLVTQADLAAERFIVAEIRKQYPSHKILAEEEVREWSAQEPVWIVDPLDGTVNFVHGISHYAVSIALYSKGKPVLGVVYNPSREELFWAENAKGAFFNGQAIQVSEQKRLQDSLLATGFPYRKDTIANNNLVNFNRVFLKCRGIRRMGVASLDLCYTACGQFDGYWELHLQPYDVAAGGLIVQEARGKVTDFAGENNWLLSGKIVATNHKIHEELRTLLHA